VRRHDRDRFQTVLFAPAARREALFALYAFNYEIARVRERISERPSAGSASNGGARPSRLRMRAVPSGAISSSNH